MKETVPKQFVFALVEDFTHLALSCAVDPLRIANLVSGQELYRWSYSSVDGVQERASDGTVLHAHSSFATIPDCTRLLVVSGLDMQNKSISELLNALRRIDRTRMTGIGALDSGAYLLARGGFLNGMQAAIHWQYHDVMMEEFPEVNTVRNVFVSSEKHITASGGTATADLMLHLIEQDHGAELSADVADQMVYNAAREATAAQKVSLQSRNGMRNAHLTRAIEIMKDSLEEPVSPAVIAAQLNISTRQLERLFGKYLNASPKKYFMELRLEKAQQLLVQTELSVIEVALACGFQSAGHFARVYRTAFGVTPMMQRGRLG
ncbi:GlxA family transcriptional regulator [Shimia sp. MMG029]|nr:GlxA family transcriptional regulator [Shimia sp. MMG029]MDA5558769.1 GlxA family transcriptional regulator [Shimia sp. MMG029]